MILCAQSTLQISACRIVVQDVTVYLGARNSASTVSALESTGDAVVRVAIQGEPVPAEFVNGLVLSTCSTHFGVPLNSHIWPLII